MIEIVKKSTCCILETVNVLKIDAHSIERCHRKKIRSLPNDKITSTIRYRNRFRYKILFIFRKWFRSAVKLHENQYYSHHRKYHEHSNLSVDLFNQWNEKKMIERVCVYRIRYSKYLEKFDFTKVEGKYRTIRPVNYVR